MDFSVEHRAKFKNLVAITNMLQPCFKNLPNYGLNILLATGFLHFIEFPSG